MKSKNYRPNVTGNSLLYRLFKMWFFPFLWFFWRRRTYNGKKEHLLRDKPLFLIPNHQNAFLDAMCLAPMRLFQQFTFLMRAASFNKKSSRFLFSLNMLPIYRQLDGTDQLDKNNETFQNCAWLMERKRPIICYAEGTHSLIRRIRPIKKGPLRFAFAAEERNNWKLDVHFIPVGINYSDREHFGGDLLVNVGKGIPLSAYRKIYEENPARALNELKKDIEAAMRPLAVHITTEKYYHEVEHLREMAINHYRIKRDYKSTLTEEFAEGARAITQAEKWLEQPGGETVSEDIKHYYRLTGGQGLRDYLFDEHYRPVPVPLNVLLFVLLFPVFAAGFLLNALPFYLPVAVAKKVVRDPAFNSSIIWAVGTILFTVYYLVMFLVVGLIWGNWWYALASWPVAGSTGIVALWYLRRWKKFRSEIKMKAFVRTPEGKQAVELRKKLLRDLYAA